MYPAFNNHGSRFKKKRENMPDIVGPGSYEQGENAEMESAGKILNSENLKYYIKLNMNQQRLYKQFNKDKASSTVGNEKRFKSAVRV